MEHAEKRGAPRQPVLRSAKVLWGATAVDCLVLDMSAEGVRVSTDVAMPFPDEVRIELRSGATWQALRRWQIGLETGFEFTRFVGLHAHAAVDAWQLYESLRNSGAHQVIERLDGARFFDHAELRSAASAAKVALDRLELMLRAASGR